MQNKRRQQLDATFKALARVHFQALAAAVLSVIAVLLVLGAALAQNVSASGYAW